MKNKSIRVFSVATWQEEWTYNDIINDKEQYGS